MKRLATLAVAAVLIVGLPQLTPYATAGDQVTIKVALTDISTATGMGPMGQWMMGYGWGQGMPGNGTMGNGMMGSGMMRPGYGWGAGVAGSNAMMSMMAIRIDHDAVKAGVVRFDVTNWSRATAHELLIVPVDDPDTPLPYDYAQTKVKEDQVKVLGDSSELAPNASHEMELTLAPGTYLLICNLPGHFAAGMATPLHVTP